MRTVIAFDVSDDRRRYRLVRVLLDRSTRVQKSVFEAPDLDPTGYLRLRSLAEGIIDPETDRLRYYRLCAQCRARTEHFGTGIAIIDPPLPFEILDP